ncbi:hypothetical protein VIBNISFn118_1470002 [Vibrio nigripulchritudo SFn118]|nr:hypothetical protein VIBNISFn118_1470002 [Vibrio nigripulchritudo SFn118]
MFEEFDRFLSMSFSIDYWEDEGIGIAANKLYDFSEQDWMELENALDLREDQWKVRCIGVLGECEHKSVFQMLLKNIVICKSQPVQIAAVDSINSLLSYTNPSTEEKSVLREVLGEVTVSSSIESILVDSLRRKIA